MKKSHVVYGLSAMTLAVGSVVASAATKPLNLTAYYAPTSSTCTIDQVTNACTKTVDSSSVIRCQVISVVSNRDAFQTVNIGGVCQVPLYKTKP